MNGNGRKRNMKNETMYHYTECGLDYVYLADGFKVHETAYGPAIEIENADALDRVIAATIIGAQKSFTGQEVRFLRGLMDMTQVELGRLLGKDAQTIARWEKDKSEIPSLEDRALRQIYLERCSEPAPKFIETSLRVSELRDRVKHAVFKEQPDGAWNLCPA
jgi:DNA-binding transcriptional regulator YiaG